MELLVATHNVGKISEYQELLANTGVQVIGLTDIGLGHLDVDETGTTFKENALLKATAYARASGRIALADDSGLCVDALDGAPGIYSARYGGQADDASRRAYLLQQLAHVPEPRTAQFVCVIAVYDIRTGRAYVAEGVCQGRVLMADSAGNNGFGYDKLFVPEGYTQSYADMESSLKNRISHRGLAVAQLPAIIAQLGT